MKTLGLITISLCCIAVPLAAQDTTHARHPAQRPHAGMGQRAQHGEMDEMMPMMREMMAPMMRVMAYTPEHLLAHRDSLKLTTDQISKLTAIQNSAKSAHDGRLSVLRHAQSRGLDAPRAASQVWQLRETNPAGSADRDLRRHLRQGHDRHDSAGRCRLLRRLVRPVQDHGAAAG